MYHIKTDKRSQTSASQIVQGLQECLKTTPLKAVTVSDIHRVTGIMRQWRKQLGEESFPTAPGTLEAGRASSSPAAFVRGPAGRDN